MSGLSCPSGTRRELDLIAEPHPVSALAMPSQEAQAHSETRFCSLQRAQRAGPSSSSQVPVLPPQRPVPTMSLSSPHCYEEVCGPFPFSLLFRPHPSMLTLALSHRGPCRCPGPSWPHAPAPGQVKAEHPTGRPLPVPGGCAARGEAGECPAHAEPMAPSKPRTGAALTQMLLPPAPGLSSHFTLTPVGTCSTVPPRRDPLQLSPPPLFRSSRC